MWSNLLEVTTSSNNVLPIYLLNTFLVNGLNIVERASKHVTACGILMKNTQLWGGFLFDARFYGCKVVDGFLKHTYNHIHQIGRAHV